MSTDAVKNNNCQPVKLPIFSTIFGAYGLILDKFKQFALLGTIFAVIMLLFYMAGGLDTFCHNRFYREAHFCTDSIPLFVTLHLLNAFIVCMFLRVWVQVALKGEKQTWRQIFIPRWADLKIAGGFLASFLTLAIATGAFYLLIVRVPNPDWRIEWAYFTFVSMGFFVPLIALRFSVYFAFVAADEKCPSPIDVWLKTRGNGFALLGGIIFLLLFGLILSQALIISLARADTSSFLTALGSEYLSNLAVIFIATCFMNYCYLQKNFLFGKDEDEKSVNA